MNLHRSQSQEDKFYEVLRRVKFTEAESRMVARAWGEGRGWGAVVQQVQRFSFTRVLEMDMWQWAYGIPQNCTLKNGQGGKLGHISFTPLKKKWKKMKTITLATLFRREL